MENFELEKREPGTSQRISDRYGALLIETLRQRFGRQFATNIPALDKLANAVARRN